MKIKAILVKVGQKPALIELEESLENLQKLVGGFIEMVQLTDDIDVDIVVNEEGKLNGSLMNKIIVHEDRVIDVLAGDLVIVGANTLTGETVSVPESKIERFINLFSRDVIEI